MGSEIKYSILIPTYNRSKVIDLTLKHLSEMQIIEFSWEVIVIDNNSNDSTKDVVGSYFGKLPIKYLFEKKQGKNIAINKGIEIARGEVLVFIDDDVTVDKNWLKAVSISVASFSDVNIFGGKVLTEWPDLTPPWVKYSSLHFPFLFSNHDLGEQVVSYSSSPLPAGANFWIRRKLLEKYNVTFNEQFGPTGNKRVAGSETEFLKRMFSKGEKILFIPGALVNHRVLYKEFAVDRLLHRFCAIGRSGLAWKSVGGSERTLFGIPLYLFRQFTAETLKGVIHILLFNKDKYMNSLLKIAFYCGRIQSFWKRSR